MFIVITDPMTGGRSEISKHPASSISQPAIKGDRLDYRPLQGCWLAPERPDYGSGCVRFAHRWRVETFAPRAAA
jgi:hypothetical protein